jgi:uncharacterized membrane protein YhaH (DUF805 family)
MTFWAAVKACYSKYATFGGRASRPEFWYFVLFNVLASIVTSILDHALFGGAPAAGAGPLSAIFTLVSLIPNLAVGCRRLHDTDRSGWWQLMAFIPIVGWILLIVWWASAGTPERNRFGDEASA